MKLEVLEPISPEILSTARNFLTQNKLKVHLVNEQKGIYVRTLISAGDQAAEAIIEKMHDNVSSLILNGTIVDDHPLLSLVQKENKDISSLEKWLMGLSLEDLIDLLKNLDNEDLAFIKEGVKFNVKLAEHGLTTDPGLGVGSTLNRLCREGLLKKDIMLAARIMTSAAADARMAGVKLPAMSSAGSGNHGLTAVLPIWAVKDYIVHGDEEEVLKAIALSHVITGYVKAHTGRLTAVCGCSIAAGAGAAVQSSLFALRGLCVKDTDGIVGITPEQTMKNIGELSSQGMVETDRTILEIMIRKQFTEN